MSIARIRLRRRRDRHRFSVACKSRNGVRSIGDAKRLVEMLVDGHAASDEVTAQRRGPDLQDPPVELHGVRIRDRPLMLNGKDPLEARRRGDERGPRLSGRDRKPAVEGGDAVGLEPGVGRGHGGHTAEPQFLRPAALDRSLEVLLAAARLGGVRDDAPNAELPEHAFHLRRVGLAARGGRVDEMARSVAVQRTKDALRFDHGP